MRFVIVADLRTGSTLLASSLDRHPRIRCLGELLHSDDLPDNGLPGLNRHALSGRRLVSAAHRPDGGPQPRSPRLAATGFRAMIGWPADSHPQWADAWDALAEDDGLQVIFLERRNHLAQLASLKLAQKSGVFHPPPGHPTLDPANRPRVWITPGELRRWRKERRLLLAHRRRMLTNKPAMNVRYADLVERWDATMTGLQRFLGVAVHPLPPAKQKQERRPLWDVVATYDQLKRENLTGGGP